MMSSLANVYPLRLLTGSSVYQRLPTHGDSSDDSADLSPSRAQRSSPPRLVRLRACSSRLLCWALAGIVLLSLLLGGGYRSTTRSQKDSAPPKKESGGGGYRWQQFNELGAYFNGIRTLVSPAEHQPENRYDVSLPPAGLTPEQLSALPVVPSMDPVPLDPYPAYSSPEYRSRYQPVEQCYLDDAETTLPPDVYVYPGLPLNLPDPFYGSYTELGLRDDVCYDRFGRLGPYGFGYSSHDGGLGPGQQTERHGSEKIFDQTGIIDYTTVDWGSAQQRCHEKNKARFEPEQLGGKERIPKQAYVLRTWVGYEYRPAQIISLRAMISELALKSGGEYDVHFLVHVKDNSLPIWADQDLYRRTLEENVPREFWNISTLWSEQLMRLYYPSPFGFNFANMVESNLHGVYRSPHFALQWFSRQHPEYDFIWNWEMDVRWTGHYYDFNSKVGAWAQKQPRKGLWERSRRFWMPHRHGNFANFTATVERETRDEDAAANDPVINGPLPVWGPVGDFDSDDIVTPPELMPPRTYDEDAYEWGVGEDADLITFNPIFDPSTTNWVFRLDATGWDAERPPPPRRAAVVTIARLSRRLLAAMHDETWRRRHTMFPEMWPASVSLHRGLKAVYAPHPVHFNRDWDLAYMDQQLNRPRQPHMSPFGWGENNLLGSTFYYNSAFSARLWRRWLGLADGDQGGRAREEAASGRMCLRPVLHHPIKREDGSEL